MPGPPPGAAQAAAPAAAQAADAETALFGAAKASIETSFRGGRVHRDVQELALEAMDEQTTAVCEKNGEVLGAIVVKLRGSRSRETWSFITALSGTANRSMQRRLLHRVAQELPNRGPGADLRHMFYTFVPTRAPRLLPLGCSLRWLRARG